MGKGSEQDPTLPRHADGYLDHLAAERGLAAHSLSAYRRDLRLYGRYLRHVGISDPRQTLRHDLAGFLSWMEEQRTARGAPYAPATVARTLVAVRGFHRFLMAEGLASSDPSTELTTRASRRRPLPLALSASQVSQLLAGPAGNTPKAQRDRAMLELLYATGLRISELVSLDVGDLDLATRSLRCPGRGGRQRVVPLGRLAAAALATWLADGRPTLAAEGPALFCNSRGRRLTRQGGWKIIKEHASAVGLSSAVSPHTLRHSFAAHLLEGGADVRVVQELLGSASAATTQVRALTPPARLRTAYDEAHPRAAAG